MPNNIQYLLYFTGCDATDPEEFLLSTLDGRGNKYNNEYLGSALTEGLLKQMIKTFGGMLRGYFDVMVIEHGHPAKHHARYDCEGKSL